MTDAPSTATAAAPGNDQGPREEQVSMTQPAAAVEMDDLSDPQPKPANHDSAVDAGPGKENSKESTATDSSAPKKDDAPRAESSFSKLAPTDITDQDMSIDPIDSAVSGESSGPAVDVMLLLTSGARHPFRIDEKYLTKRNVTVTGKTDDGHLDPFSITVYTLKELILRDWRKEWDQPPREPSAIRLIHFGRMLEDRMALNQYQFSNASRNVIHMTVKPQEIIDEEEAAKKVKDSGSERHRGGCCVIL